MDQRLAGSISGWIMLYLHFLDETLLFYLNSLNRNMNLSSVKYEHDFFFLAFHDWCKISVIVYPFVFTFSTCQIMVKKVKTLTNETS